MKIILSIATIVLGSLYANQSWIKIEPLIENQASKSPSDVNLSQIEPINKMMEKVIVMKQLVDVASKKEKQINDEKNWFKIKTEDDK